MKTLTHYAKNGYDFTILERVGDIALCLGISRAHGGQNWEVIKIQSHNGLQMGANWVEPSQFPPNSNSWGQKGWTGFNEADARRIFNEKINETREN